MPSRAADGQTDPRRDDAAGDWTTRRERAARDNELADALRTILGRSTPAWRRGLPGVRGRARHEQRPRGSGVPNLAWCGLRADQRHALRLGLLPRGRDLASRVPGFGRPENSAPELAKRPGARRRAAGHGAAHSILGRLASGGGSPVREPDVRAGLLRSTLGDPVRQKRGGAVSRAARHPGPHGASVRRDRRALGPRANGSTRTTSRATMPCSRTRRTRRRGSAVSERR